MRLRPMWRLREVAARYSRGTPALAISGGYTVIVACVAVFVIIDTAVKPGSLAGIWLGLATMPTSLLTHFIPEGRTTVLVFLIMAGIFQAWLLWVILRGKRLR